ncbi:MAG: nucleotidyltransferase domain-containing protein [Candidatus Wallbacteria bacterium]|nr:nucleotidyltransferase domain-containing protein [Candidatus Wallbacteria bacterium]
MTDVIFHRIRLINDRLVSTFNVQKVILFGSCASGTSDQDSDIDLLVVYSTEQKFHERTAAIKKAVRDLSKGLTISPIGLNPMEFESRCSAGDPFVLSILEQGIVL